MIKYLFKKFRKGQMSSIPITQIIKIIAAILAVSAILGIVIPMVFDGMDAACKMLKGLLESMNLKGIIMDQLGMLEC